MPNFDFTHGPPAVNFKEPQIGKRELLGSPPRADFAFEQEDVKPATNNSALGPGLKSSTWGFGALDDLFTTNAPETSAAQPEQNVASPRAPTGNGLGSSSHKRPNDEHNAPGQPAAKKSKAILVVDLTSDAEDEDTGLRDEPRGRSNTTFGRSTNTFSAAQMNSGASMSAFSQARPTFRRGLSPYAAHKRKPAETHRAKPPIKPQDYSQLRQSEPAPPQKHAVFTRRQSSTISPSPGPSPPAGLLGRLNVRTQTATPKTVKKGGPFIQEDSSDEEQPVTKQKTRSPSVSFLSSARFKTPARDEKVQQLQQSRLKRQQRIDNGNGNSSGAAAALPGPSNPQIGEAQPTNDDDDQGQSAEDDAAEIKESFLRASASGADGRRVATPSIEDPFSPDGEDGSQFPLMRKAKERMLPEQYERVEVDGDVGENSMVASSRAVEVDTNDVKPVDGGQETPRAPEIQVAERVQHEDNAKGANTVQPSPPESGVVSTPSFPTPPARKRPLDDARQKNLKAQIRAISEKQRREEAQNRMWEEREQDELARYGRSPAPTSLPSRHSLANPGIQRLIPSPPPAPAPKKPKSQGISQVDKFRADTKRDSERRAQEKAAINRRRREDDEANDKSIEAEMQREAEANHQIARPAPYGLGISMNMQSEPRREPVPTTEAAPTARPPGPFSLNSAAGIAAISKTCDPPATAPRRINLPFEERPKKAAAGNIFGRGPPKLRLKTSLSHRRRLGTLTAADFALVRWKAERINADEVVRRFKEMTGQDRARGTLADRQKQVATALQTENISPELRETAVAGDATAADEVNEILQDMQMDETQSIEDQRLASGSGSGCGSGPGKFRHQGEVTEVTASDISLVKWRDLEHSWREVIDMYRQLTGETKAQETLRTRYRKVKAAIEAVEEITTKLCERVIDGENDALEELNSLLIQKLREREGTVTGTSAAAHIQGTNTHRSWQKGGRANDADTHARTLSQGLASPPYSEGSSSSETASQRVQRPDKGGKTFSEEVFQAYMEHVREAFYEDEEDVEEQQSEREPSPFNPEDYCHYVYQVERRECTKSQAEDEGMTVEDRLEGQPWLRCLHDFDDLDNATIAVMTQIMRRPRGTEAIASARHDWNLSRKADLNGLIEATLSSDVGKVQMRVIRYMRSYHENVMPESKEKWYPKTVYYVQVRTSMRTAEDKFESDDKESDIQQHTLNDTCFTTLELANSHAIDEWIRRTLKYTTANLDQRAIKRNEIKMELEELLEEDGEDARFSRESEELVGDEGASKKTKVWVKEGKLAGPRNL